MAVQGAQRRQCREGGMTELAGRGGDTTNVVPESLALSDFDRKTVFELAWHRLILTCLKTVGIARGKWVDPSCTQIVFVVTHTETAADISFAVPLKDPMQSAVIVYVATESSPEWRLLRFDTNEADYEILCSLWRLLINSHLPFDHRWDTALGDTWLRDVETTEISDAMFDEMHGCLHLVPLSEEDEAAAALTHAISDPLAPLPTP